MFHELVKITLHNEMDLVLAHRSSMKLAELTGLSLSAQTTFATAVSEVCRHTIDNGADGYLLLCVSDVKQDKYIIARILDKADYQLNNQGLEYAKRLVSTFSINTAGNKTAIELNYAIPHAHRIDVQKNIPEWKKAFSDNRPFSPYEEIKRKNEQLQVLAARLQDSENQYKALTNSLPIIIFSLNEEGKLVYANEWLTQFTGRTMEELNASSWKDIVHPADYDAFKLLFPPRLTATAAAIKAQFRLKHTGEPDYFWHLASLSPVADDKGESHYWTGFIVDINAQKLIEEALQDNRELKKTQRELKDNQVMLEDNINKLNQSNMELQQFAFIASHDLQEPIRKISFYSDLFLNKYSEKIDTKGQEYLKGILSASGRMRTLIHDLLSFSQVERKSVEFERTDLNDVVKDALQDLEIIIREKDPEISVENLPVIDGDKGTLRQLFANIIGNSLKYAKKNEKPVIHISSQLTPEGAALTVRDNGIGFDEKYLPKMFTLFQRLHGHEQYKGTGLGLAICRRIVEMHNGQITATSRENEGAAFTVTLPVNQSPA